MNPIISKPEFHRTAKLQFFSIREDQSSSIKLEQLTDKAWKLIDKVQKIDNDIYTNYAKS